MSFFFFHQILTLTFYFYLESDSSSWLTDIFFLQWLCIGLTGNDHDTRIVDEEVDDEEAYNAVNNVEEDGSDATD